MAPPLNLKAVLYALEHGGQTLKYDFGKWTLEPEGRIVPQRLAAQVRQLPAVVEIDRSYARAEYGWRGDAA